MSNNNPKISIITVSYNAVKTIEQTILSVIEQAYDNIEYIVIDGKSTDGTVDIIKKYEDRIACWVSEPDQGIYDAMNKGIDIATGEWIYFIGADDCLLEIPKTTLEEAMGSNVMLIYGNVLLSSGEVFISRWDNKLKYNNTLHHQGLFVRAEMFKNQGFDPRYKIYSDFDFNQKLFKLQVRVIYINSNIAKYNLYGRSSTVPLREKMTIVYKNFGFLSAIISFIKYIYYIFKIHKRKNGEETNG